MTEILAVHPNGGELIHLYSPGYVPGRKPRSAETASGMCGAWISSVTGRTAPLAEARDWPKKHSCGAWTPNWRWCRACLGHAAVLVGLAAALVDDILDKITPCSCEGRRWVEDKNWSPEYPGEWNGVREPGKGLIPCGRCNHGGWHIDEYEVDKP